MKKHVGLVLSLLFGLGATQALAQSSGNTSTEVEQKKSPVAIQYLGDAKGTSIGRPSSFYPTPEGQDAGLTTITNYVYFLYYLNDEHTARVGLVPRFSLQPVRGWSLKALDPRVHIKWNNILASANDAPFTMGLRLRTELPLTQDAKDNDRMLTPTITLYPKYKISSQWSILFATHAQTVFFDGPGKGDIRDQQDVAFSFTPELTYSINDKIGLRLDFDFSTAHYRFDPIANFFRDGSSSTLYFDWNATSKVTVTPTFTFYPAAKLNANSTTVGLEVFAAIL